MSCASSCIRGRILTPTGWIEGELRFAKRVENVRALGPDALGELGSGDLPFILPGFIDLHVHGGEGADVMQGGDAALRVARTHARHGTTALLATTMTACVADVERALRGIARSMNTETADAAEILGVHLEGPFISRERLGAQPPEVLIADEALIQRWHAIAPLRAITLAPEIEGHLALIPRLAKLGIRIQLGHSNGSYEDAVAAMDAGATGFTHLFNGMSGLHHRNPGLVGAALARAEFAEIIPDLEHVASGALRAAFRAIPRAYAVTDATAATDMPDGAYQLGTQKVLKCFGCVRLAVGDSLAGSALTMDQSLRNLVSLGMELADVSDRLSRFPAEYLGLDDRGRIEPGCISDFVVVDSEMNVVEVWARGRPLSDPVGLNGA